MRLIWGLILGFAVHSGIAIPDPLTPTQGMGPPSTAAPEESSVFSEPPPESTAVESEAEPGTTANEDFSSPVTVSEEPATDTEVATGGFTSASLENTAFTTEAPEETATGLESTQPAFTTFAGSTEILEGTTTAEEPATGTSTGIVETSAAGTSAARTSAASTSAASTSATSTAAVAPVDLKDATVGENAKIEEIDGQTAIVLTAPANGQASFSVDATKPEGLSSGEKVVIVASVVVGDSGTAMRRRGLGRRDSSTACSLKMALDGVTVYDKTVSNSNGKALELTSNALQASDKPKVEMTQQCGDQPVSMSVRSVNLAGESSTKISGGASSTDSAGGSQESGGASGGSSGTGSSGSSTLASGTQSAGDSKQTGSNSLASRSDIAMALLISLLALAI